MISDDDYDDDYFNDKILGHIGDAEDLYDNVEDDDEFDWAKEATSISWSIASQIYSSCINHNIRLVTLIVNFDYVSCY